MSVLISEKTKEKIFALVNTLLGTDYKFSGFGDDMPVISGVFQGVITVFNYHQKTGTWYPTVINNAHIVSASASTHGTTGNINADSVEVQITSNRAQHVSTPSGNKSYTLPKDYAVSNTPEEYVTFTPECDFFFVGKWDDLTPVEDDDFDEGFYHAMNQENDGVYMINNAAYFSLVPHFEIGGR